MSKQSNPEYAADVAACKAVARRLVKARKAEAEVWTEAKETMKDAHLYGGLTYAEIAEIFGFTKARVYQIVTGRRGNNKSVAALVEAS